MPLVHELRFAEIHVIAVIKDFPVRHVPAHIRGEFVARQALLERIRTELVMICARTRLRTARLYCATSNQLTGTFLRQKVP